MIITSFLAFIAIATAVVVAVCAVVFVGVPVLKVVGSAVVATLRGIGWLLSHVVGFVVGMLRDSVRLVGALIATVLFVPLLAGSVVIGRWSSANHFASSILRELRVGGACLYRVVLQRPLRLLLLDGLLEGVEQRVPEALAEAPGPDRPSRRLGQFPGYTIVGSLRPGGSGAKLYVAEPNKELRVRRPGMPDQVVIKTFAITDGSSLPQIVRESRSLDAARRMGLIVDHGLDEHRFFYVMPYHAGESLGVATRQLHGESAGEGLSGPALRRGLGYVVDLVETLRRYHEGGLWHKDVKPDNIIVHAGRAHLVDLGLVTPLHSAMTLTTHGTEYFRDPEMVRLALRGVKVHQVDGAKFDVYACGAVLYFLLENTFPAHGGLSSFGKRSPEALRWIVRRAMADYAKRYESAEVLLGDLRHVASAADPFTVRPADLPSVRSAGADGLRWDDEPVAVERAGTGDRGGAGPRRGASPPVPPPSAWTPAAVPPMAAAAVPAAGTAGTGSPRLEITNWWTGAFRMADGHDAASPLHGHPSKRPDGPRSRWSRTPVPPAPGRSSAAVQRRAAWERAEQRRRKAGQHVAARLHRPAQPGAAVVALVLLLVAGVVGGMLLLTRAATFSVDGGTHTATAQRQSAQSLAQSLAQLHGYPPPRFASVPVAPAAPVAPVASIPIASGGQATTLGGSSLPAPHDAPGFPAAAGPLRRAVLVNAHADPAGSETLASIDRAMADQRRAGYEVCTDDVETIAQLLILLPRWKQGDQAASEAIEEVLATRGYAAILWVVGGGRDARDRIETQIIESKRADAAERTDPCGE